MRVKKVTLQGFKSFMNRLELTFSSGISAVVGPNGCGKSNIVDAIRWCMGEQSPKQLRGRKMEDVIFNGGGEYKPVGMAEVTLVFENGQSPFPSPFSEHSELSITRRLYRSGESEYLINNIPSRLKDIQEVFMDTGLGNRAYSVIGQGKIDTIVEQKPEDTRIMLEEAAGITKYRRKAEASQRKIELTEANLQRVEDILVEVKKQMNSLKRQAAKARRYKEICREIELMELRLYANKYNQLKQDSGIKEKAKEDLVQKELAKSTALSQVHSQIENMNLELEKRDSDLAEKRKVALELRERLQRKESGIESLSREMKMLEEVEQRLKSEQEDIKEKIERLEAERGELEGKIEKLKGDSSRLQGESEFREKRLKEKQKFLETIREDFEKARKEMNEGANKETGLNHESGYFTKLLEQISDSQSRLEKEIEDVKGKTETIIKASDRKGEVREATLERLKELETIIEQEGATYKELEQIKKRIEDELKSAEAELNKSQSRLDSLKALAASFEGYKRGVRSIMKARDLKAYQQGRILGLVADVIQVDEGYEQAVEALLADKVQYVVVESQDDGKEAVDYLKNESKGRCSFIPLRDIKGNGREVLERNGFRPIVDFVSCPDEYRPVVDCLLGSTLLVDSVEHALSVWKEGNEGFSFVTLEGDIIDERGIISGGKVGQGNQGILSRKREIIELEGKCIQYGKQVEELKERLENVSEEIEEKSQTLENLREDKFSCQEEINEFDKQLFRLGQELDQLERYREKLESDLERKGIEQRKNKKELQRVEEELESRKAKREQEEAYFSEKEKEFVECQQEYEQSKEELAKIQSDYRLLVEEQKSVAREIDMKEENREDCLERQKKIEEEVEKGRSRLGECRDKREELKEELSGLYEKVRKAEETVEQLDRERQEFRSRIREEEKKEEHLRAEVEELKERISGANMEYSEIKLRMDSIVEQVRDKFSVSLEQVYEQYLDDESSAIELEEKLEHKKSIRQKLGEVNLTAIKEHEALKERYEFIKGQRQDLINSIESLREAIKKINKKSLEKFREVFHNVDQKLKEVFPILFNGGTAGLRLSDEFNPLDSGVFIEVKPPGKKLSHMTLLSGGEKALVAMAFLFAIYLIKPSPFCLLDEVDAPLDEANIDRFNDLLKEIKRNSQIIMVTHNKRSMEMTDRLYGVTMETAGISKTVAVDLEAFKKEVGENGIELAEAVAR